MNALMIITLLLGGFERYPSGIATIWFKDVDSCNKSMSVIQESFPLHRDLRNAEKWSNIVCIPVSQGDKL